MTSFLTSKSGNHILEFDIKNHVYKLDSEIVEGVTSTNKDGYPEPYALREWKIRQASDYAIRRLLKYKKKPGEEKLKQIVKDSINAYRKKAYESADVGSIVHSYAECVNLGKPFDMKLVEGHKKEHIIRRCMESFLQWKSTTGKDELLASEQLVASIKHKFGGMLDGLYRVNDKIRIRDYKTSNAFYVDQLVQLSAYAIAVNEWLSLPVQEIEIIRFPKTTGKFEVKLIDDEYFIRELKEQFLRNLATSRFRRKYESSR